jgi:hypothetical protein
MCQVLKEQCNLRCWLQECPPELLPEFNVNFSIISHLHFREFGSLSNWPQPLTTCTRCVVERSANVSVVSRVPHGGGGVMVWASISYEAMNTMAFYWWQFECTKKKLPWLNREAHFFFKVSMTNRCISVFPEIHRLGPNEFI